MKTMFTFSRFNCSSVYSNVDTGELFDSPELVNYDNFSLTEQAGYKPPRLQVLDFLIAGERLITSQQALYYQSDIEPLFDEDGEPILPRLLTTRDPYVAKKDIDYFSSKLNEYKELFYNRKNEEFNRRLAESEKYKKFYEAHNKDVPPET